MVEFCFACNCKPPSLGLSASVVHCKCYKHYSLLLFIEVLLPFHVSVVDVKCCDFSSDQDLTHDGFRWCPGESLTHFDVGIFWQDFFCLYYVIKKSDESNFGNNVEGSLSLYIQSIQQTAFCLQIILWTVWAFCRATKRWVLWLIFSCSLTCDWCHIAERWFHFTF